MVDQANAALLRRWAMQCFAQAQDPRASGNERARLLEMRTALLEQAELQEWLGGIWQSDDARLATREDVPPLNVPTSARD